MKKTFLCVVLCVAIILWMSCPAMAELFIVEINGEKVVLQYFDPVQEQAWQYSSSDDPGWWPGLAPHPFDLKIWYPRLSDTTGMVLSEQLEWIEDLRYAGIHDWRIGYFWDTIPLKASIFGGLILDDFNRVSGFDTSVYFPPTAPWTVARTGDELPGNGAIIEAGGGFGFPTMDYVPPPDGEAVPVPCYPPDGPRCTDGYRDNTFYMLVPSHAEDHWAHSSSTPGSYTYDDDVNCTSADLPYCDMGRRGLMECGAWTVSEAIPELWPPNHKFNEITISGIRYVEGYNPRLDAWGTVGVPIPLEIISVYQDEPVAGSCRCSSDPDAIIRYTDAAAVVEVRAERVRKGNGRVYHISFTDGEMEYTFKVGVPEHRCKRHPLVDDGPLYDSTVEGP